MGFAQDELSQDGFLGGQLHINQPKHGYRAATDPVLLAASIQAAAGQTVLELGCGVGVASLCLGRRIGGLSQTGVERQEDYADLAARNAAENGLELAVCRADLVALPAEILSQSFDHVIANPPYLATGEGTPARDAGKEAALREDTPLAQWLDVMIRRLKPGGMLGLIHLAERLPDLLRGLDDRVGSIEVKPIAARRGRAAGRVLLRARKGARGAFCLYAPLVMHQGDHHNGDGNSFNPEMQNVLRHGAALRF